MKTVSLDVHAEASQMFVISDRGEVVLEMKVATEPGELRRIAAAIPGPKRLVFEEGPLSGMIWDALADLFEEVTSCDSAHNALIALAEDSNDERDARRLAMLAQVGAVRPVYVPTEPYRTLRSLLMHDRSLEKALTATKNRIKALCRRCGVRYRGPGVYRKAARAEVLRRLSNAYRRWQMRSNYRVLDMLRTERTLTHRELRRLGAKLPIIRRLQGIPGVGPTVARTIVGWIVEPGRFRNHNALSSYGGLGLGQGWTNWQPVGRARASRRGNRELKRVLLLAAQAAAKSHSALGRRYQARLAAGWDAQRAMRDLARKILFTACGIWRTGKEYDDAQVAVPRQSGQ